MARAFPNVDRVSLRAIVAARLSKPKDRAFGVPVPKNLHKLPGALYYMARRGFVRYFAIQWGDGLLHFLFNPPTVIDLSRKVRRAPPGGGGANPAKHC